MNFDRSIKTMNEQRDKCNENSSWDFFEFTKWEIFHLNFSRIKYFKTPFKLKINLFRLSWGFYCIWCQKILIKPQMVKMHLRFGWLCLIRYNTNGQILIRKFLNFRFKFHSPFSLLPLNYRILVNSQIKPEN